MNKSLIFCLFMLPLVIFAEERALENDVRVKAGIKLFQDWVDSRIAQDNIPGAFVAIVSGGSVVWSKGYGSIKPDSLVAVSSLTKPMTACAIMKLWQNGKINLEVPIDFYLPQFSIRGYSKNRPITIRQLLNHTSGLPQDADFPYWNDLVFPTFDALMEKMKEQELVYPPGSHWKYSHLGYALLGKVIEVVSGQSYSDYLKRQLFTPLGMENTTFYPETLKELVAGGYSSRLEKGIRELLPSYKTVGLKPALGLYSTVQDLCRFMAYYLSIDAGLNVLSLEARRFMTKNPVRLSPTLYYGYGWQIRSQNEFELIEHPGNMPGYSAYMSLAPRDGSGLVILTNTQEDLASTAREAVRWVFTALRLAKRSIQTAEKVPSHWKKYVGQYECPEGQLFVEVFQDSLVLYQPMKANMLDKLVPQPDGTFRVVEGYAFGDTNGDRVTFTLDNAGKVASMKIGNLILTPAS